MTVRSMTKEEVMKEGLEEKVPDVLPVRERIAPPHVEWLKQTRSVCPTCLGIVDADIGVEDGEVWMYKRCAAHGFVKGFVETNPEFYRSLMNQPPIDKMAYHSVVIPVTHRCNLNCTLCYVPRRDRDDLTLEALKRIIDEFPGQCIALSGGEPTLREDLLEVMRHVRARGKSCRLISNAVKLADKDFLRRLIDAGLQEILFSFNGFSDRVYQSINGMPLLSTKLKALENCVREKLDISLSPTVFKGLNEEELGPIIRLSLSNFPYINEVRIRGAARVGRYEKIKPLSTYELFKLVADAIGHDVTRLISEFEPEKSYHSIIQFNIMAAFHARASQNKFYCWNPGFYAKGMDDDRWLKEFQDKVFQDFGWQLPVHLMQNHFKFLNLNIWGWPDADNIDFQEIWSHGVYHLHDNKTMMNFCEAMLRAEEL